MGAINRRDLVKAAAAIGTTSAAGPFCTAFAQGTGPIKVGITTALTGPYNEFGEGSKRGFDLAIDQCNAKGGINGRRIEYGVVLDDQQVPDRAAQNMRRILDDKSLAAVLGCAGSGPTLAVADMVSADGRPYINPLAQSPAATYPNGMDKPPRRNMFTFSILNSVEAEVLGKFVAKTYKSIGLMHESTGYGVSGKDALQGVIKGARGDISIQIEAYTQRATDVTAQLLRLQRAGVEALVVVGLGSDLVNIRRTMVRTGLQVPLVTSAGGLSLPYLEGAGETAVGTVAPMCPVLIEKNPRPQVAEFMKAYKAKYGADRYWGQDPYRPLAQMSLIVVPGYDGANMLFEAMRRASSTEPEKVITAFEGITNMAGVNTTYSFSAARHHGIAPADLSMVHVVKRGNRIELDLMSS